MADFNTPTLNDMLDSINPDTVSLHSGDPGPDGLLNEIAGGTPPYARQGITFGAAAGGNRNSTNQPLFDVGAGTSVAWVGFWEGATYRGAKALAAAEVFTSQGQFRLTDADLTLT